MLVKLSRKGGVLIPASMRKKFRLRPGTDLQIVDSGGVLTILPNLNEFSNDGIGTINGDTSSKQKRGGVELHHE
jgi:AbrB family looped-hinge helix DNA binding protein